MPAARRRANNSGWVDRLPSGRYRARFTGPDGVKRAAPSTFGTKGDAQAWLDLQSLQVRAGTWSIGDQVHGTFEQYADDWLEDRDLKPSTRAHYATIIEQQLKPAFGSKPLAAITVASVRTWYRNLSLKPTIKAHTYGLLRTILNSAWQEELIPANPCRIRGAGNVRRATRTEVPSAEQIARLAQAMGRTKVGDHTVDEETTVPVYAVLADSKYEVMTLVAAWCGLRFGEAIELRRKDIVWEGEIPATVRVQRGAVRVDGEWVIGPPKSEAGVRTVVIPPHVRQQLADYLKTRPDEPEAMLFPGSRNGSHMSPGALQKVFYRARKEVGLDHLRWHDLRHFSATTAARTGATTAELQARLGHSTTAAAMRYQHAVNGADARIADGMSKLAGWSDEGT